MQARDVMTKDVAMVAPETPTRDIARLLLDRHVSAVPVVDGAGTVVGMVSEGDLIGRSDADREARRDWWLTLLAEGEELHPDFVASLTSGGQPARDVMTAPVVSIGAATEVPEIAALLARLRIKRVPVLQDNRLVGIVSRADLLRALAAEPAGVAAAEPVAHTRGLLAEAIATLDRHFLGHGGGATQAPSGSQAVVQGGLSAADFQSLMAGFEHRKAEQEHAQRRAAGERRGQQVKKLIDEHVRDEKWHDLLHRAREAAQGGEKELLLLRFPSELCADRGRAINAALPEWPQTLRGEAAELYLRWESELKPGGFRLAARVLDFPRGMPGDIGLFLGWGE